MKKLFIVLLGFGFIFPALAQKRKHRPQFSVEQKTELTLKKMTLDLDLSNRQQRKIRPLLTEKYSHREAIRKQRKLEPKTQKQFTSEERYQKALARLDKRIAFKNSMKNILNETQYRRFEKSVGHKKRQIQKRRKQRKMRHFRQNSYPEKG